MVLTRRKSNHVHWLIGGEDDKICGNKLPSNHQVLRFFLYQHFTMKKTIRNSAMATVTQTLEFWQRGRIPTRQNIKAAMKVEKLYKQYTTLMKSKNKQSPGYNVSRENFYDSLDNIFDIAHSNALVTMEKQEDRDFLMAQREKGRRGCMISVDKVLAKHEAKQYNRIMNSIKRKNINNERRTRYEQRESNRLKNILEINDLVSDSDNSIEEDEVVTNFECSKKRKTRGYTNLVTPQMISLLDRAKCSYRVAAAVINSSLDKDIAKETNINKSTLQRMSIKIRRVEGINIKENFCGSGPYVVHWDGKMLKDLTGVEKSDRLPIIITGKS
jgi:hypothetical protein